MADQATREPNGSDETPREAEPRPAEAGIQTCPQCGSPMPDLRGGRLSVCRTCGYKDDCC